jgi:hypothetical protein
VYDCYKKIKAGLLDNNFVTDRLSSCHMKIKDQGPVNCSVRRSDGGSDGIVRDKDQ